MGNLAVGISISAHRKFATLFSSELLSPQRISTANRLVINILSLIMADAMYVLSRPVLCFEMLICNRKDAPLKAVQLEALVVVHKVRIQKRWLKLC